jgi:maleylpyruvate isomerase
MHCSLPALIPLPLHQDYTVTPPDSNLILHSYFRSSASYRVRIALNLKQIPYDYTAIHLLRDGGEQLQPRFRSLNPQSLVPVLQDQDTTISQSLAILEYLEETYPAIALLPSNRADRAYVRQIALAIACEIHPLNNLRVLKHLSKNLNISDEQKNQWIGHWISLGFEGLEELLGNSQRRGSFCFGDSPTFADCCLIPQMYNAQRFNVDLTGFPTLLRIADTCNALDAFRNAAPNQQPDTQ